MCRILSVIFSSTWDVSNLSGSMTPSERRVHNQTFSSPLQRKAVIEQMQAFKTPKILCRKQRYLWLEYNLIPCSVFYVLAFRWRQGEINWRTDENARLLSMKERGECEQQSTFSFVADGASYAFAEDQGRFVLVLVNCSYPSGIDDLSNKKTFDESGGRK